MIKRWLALALVSTSSLPGAAAQDAATTARDPVPVEAFAALPKIEAPSLSPDGTRIVGKMAVNSRQMLVIVPLTGGSPAVLSADERIDINWWRWVNDGWLAVGVGAQDRLYGEDVYVTRLIGISADGKRANRIDWARSGLRADELIWAAHDGSPRVLLAKQTGIDKLLDFYPSVFEVDLSTGKTRKLVNGEPDVFDWFADGKGQVRMGLRYTDGGQRMAVRYRPSNDADFLTVARSASKDGQHNVLVPMVFRADGTALATDSTDGRDELYELSLPDLKLGRKVYASERYDIDGVVLNRTMDDVSGILLTEKSGRTEWLDPEIKEIQAAVDKAVGNRRARLVSWNSDRSRFLIEVGSAAQAGALYFWDVRAGAMKHLGWNNEQLKGRVLSPVTTIDYQARDGTKLNAVLTLPRGRPPKNLPLIVLPHGGPFARDEERWDWWTQYLAELGYAVVQPNYRGSSGHGRALAAAGEGEWGLKMQDDLNDALAYLAAKGIADPKRVCMVGASYGGYAAMRAAQRDGRLYRCAISYAGVSDLRAMQKYDSKFLLGKTRAAWLQKQAPDYQAVSPRFHPADFSIPILLVHGREDKRVPVKQSRMLADALKGAGKAHEYVEQPLGDHHFTRGEDRLHFLNAMKAFLTKHNPA